jgi:tetratricopeptide (TPR) repeat protein
VLPLALRMMGWRAPGEDFRPAPAQMWIGDDAALRELPPYLAPDAQAEPHSPIDHLLSAGYQPRTPPGLAGWAARQRAADLAQLARLRLAAGDAAGAARLAAQAEQLHAARPFTELTARAAFIAGDVAAAAAAADRLLAADPQSPAGHLLKMFLAHNDAAASASARLDATPEQKYYAGVLAMLRGEPASAAQLLKDAADAMPSNSHVLHALGLAYRQAGDLPQAIQILARAANLSARPAVVLVHFAQALLSAGDDVRAENALRQALTADPGCAAAAALLEAVLRRRRFHLALSAEHSAAIPVPFPLAPL